MILAACAMLAIAGYTALSQRLPDDDPVTPLYRYRLRVADSLMGAGRLHESIAMLEELRGSYAVRARTEDYGSLLMRLARAYGEVHDSRRSLERAREAYELGVRVLPDLLTDERFAALRSDSLFQRLVDDARAHQTPWESRRSAARDLARWQDTIPLELRAYGLSSVWSAVKYDFAYRDRVALNWDSLYVATLRTLVSTTSPYDYYRALQRMLARLGDGHTAVAMPSDLTDSFSYFPPIKTALIEGRVIVTNVLGEKGAAGGIAVGDEILAVDGLDVHAYANDRIVPWVSASSPQDLSTRVYDHHLLSGSPGSNVELDIGRADGARRRVGLTRRWCVDDLDPMSTVEHAFLRSSIGYCAINTFSDEYVVELFDHAMARLSRSRALIVDLRTNTGGHSRLAFEVLSRLMDTAFATHAWETPMHRAYFYARGRDIEWYRERSGGFAGRGTGAYRGPVVVLIGPRTLSAAEIFVVAFDFAQRGVLVGEPTAGSTGHTLSVPLPGGGMAMITTTRDTYPDGRLFNGIGIVPQIAARMSAADVRAGRDAVIETALDYLEELLKSGTSVVHRSR